MTAFASDRTMACSGGRMAVRGGEGGNTTARWRDKSARCAAWCGRVFSVAYGALARGAPDRRGLRVRDFCKDFLGFRSEEHTSELQSLMRISYAVFCLKKKKNK